MVVLTHPTLGDREFEPDHAERILAMENNGGWTKKRTRKRKTQKGAATNGDQGNSIQAQAQTTDSDCGCP